MTSSHPLERDPAGGQLQGREIVLASNRAPVAFRRLEGGGTTITGGVGSLAASLRTIADRLPDRIAWVAATTGQADRLAVAAGRGREASSHLGYPVRFVAVDEATYERYYQVASNRMLWFANHALWDELGIDRVPDEQLPAWTEGYEAVNAAFAHAVAGVAGQSSSVLFQDYHLATAPGHLRRLRPDQAIAHFTHSPFCGPDSLRRLPGPVGRAYVTGMLGADLVGFHTAAWCEAFLDACESYGLPTDRAAGRVEHGGRAAWVRAYPIPVDAQQLCRRAAGAPARAWATHFIRSGRGRLLVRVDRVDPAKNILRGFVAFGRVLDRREDLRDTRFVACLYSTREAMREYRDYTARIRALVAELQRRHPGSVELFVEDLPDRALGALLVYDVLLVNPLLDGMNLVAKEGAVLNERAGVLVLSHGAGAFAELGGHAVALSEPASVEATAAALERALCMPAEERARRAAGLHYAATARTPLDWLTAQLTALRSIRRGRTPSG